MLLTPRYDGADLLRFEAAAAPDPSVPLLRQRRRLADLLAGLDADQWAAQSRCDAWTVRDVVAHLIDTDRFWAFAVGAARAGEPTRFLATFDPVKTPAQLVDAMAEQGPEEILAGFRSGVDALAVAFDDLDEAGWARPGEAPPGHVPLRAVALHALWDGWVHERDIALPLGLDPTEDSDEVTVCLPYAAALGPAFLATRGSTREGSIRVEAPDVGLVLLVDVGPTIEVRRVEADDASPTTVTLTGGAVELLEALSFRAPLPHDIPEDDVWILSGLATVFEVGTIA